MIAVLIEEYSLGYKMLRDSIRELSEEEIRFKPGKDKWSIHQIIIHITDSELVSTHRLKKLYQSLNHF
ncbi:DinB family protein [Cytobacillus oceanisediminis]|uniref:DinB family protein n=1 Tax=Cytobacillus oceanisediminis TaxID=665099 RepID=UPI00299DEE2A|nr:DinB family protein [Cytobacillus oceanisediminis]